MKFKIYFPGTIIANIRDELVDKVLIEYNARERNGPVSA
jgi:hypothetical protein